MKAAALWLTLVALVTPLLAIELEEKGEQTGERGEAERRRAP